MNVKIPIGEFMMTEPSFRKKTRLVAIVGANHHVYFALEYMHDGEPGAWLSDPSFPWHRSNFDAVIRAAARYHERIEEILRKEK